MQAPRRLPQERVQHVLLGLRQWRPLLCVPRIPPPRSSHHPDTEVFLPRRDQGVGDPEGAGHSRRADLHHQQCSRRLPQRTPPAQARQGRHQHLRGLRAQPPRLLPLLLPRVQDCGDVQGLPEETEEEGGGGGLALGLRLGGVLHHGQERQEQRHAGFHPLHPAGHLRQLPPHQQAAQGHPPPCPSRQHPRRRVLAKLLRHSQNAEPEQRPLLWGGATYVRPYASASVRCYRPCR